MIKIILAVAAGGIFITGILYIFARAWNNAHRAAEENKGIYEDRYVSSKKGCPRRDERP